MRCHIHRDNETSLRFLTGFAARNNLKLVKEGEGKLIKFIYKIEDTSPILVAKNREDFEKEFEKTANSSCRVGLLKLKVEILFKLYEVQRSNDYQVLLKRIEPIEKRLEFLESQRQKDGEKSK